MAELSSREAEIYDRQIRLWGVEAQQRLRGARVYILGMAGVGAEVAKNLVLAGISVTLLDSALVEPFHFGANFLLEEGSVGKNVSKSLQCRISALRALSPPLPFFLSTLGLSLSQTPLSICPRTFPRARSAMAAGTGLQGKGPGAQPACNGARPRRGPGGLGGWGACGGGGRCRCCSGASAPGGCLRPGRLRACGCLRALQGPGHPHHLWLHAWLPRLPLPGRGRRAHLPAPAARARCRWGRRRFRRAATARRAARGTLPQPGRGAGGGRQGGLRSAAGRAKQEIPPPARSAGVGGGARCSRGGQVGAGRQRAQGGLGGGTAEGGGGVLRRGVGG